MVTVAQACDFQNTDGIQASFRGFFLVGFETEVQILMRHGSLKQVLEHTFGHCHKSKLSRPAFCPFWSNFRYFLGCRRWPIGASLFMGMVGTNIGNHMFCGVYSTLGKVAQIANLTFSSNDRSTDFQ